MSALTADCYSCISESQFDLLPPRERIAADAHWRLAHAWGTGLPGWLVLVPRRHVISATDLTDPEAATLGVWQVRAARALHAATGCVKTYIALFAEKDGFEHVHFHLVPRAADIPADRRGPAVFAYLHPAQRDLVTDAEADELALAVRAHLEST